MNAEDPRRERDALREAILTHRDAQRPSLRRPHDEELYAALATVHLDEMAAEHLRRQQDYYESPYLGY